MIDALATSSCRRLPCQQLRIRLIRLERVTLDADALLPAMEEHLQLIAALRTRDPQRAVAALDAHLTHARNRALGF